MRKIVSLRGCLFLAVLLTLPGCGRLNYETTVPLGAGEIQALRIDAPRREQKVSVTVTSAGSPVDVYVILEKDKAAAEEALLDRKKPAASLAGTMKVQEATLQATIPANTAFVVLLGGANKPSQVKVKVTGH
jgi:hypothetical protein